MNALTSCDGGLLGTRVPTKGLSPRGALGFPKGWGSAEAKEYAPLIGGGLLGTVRKLY